MISFKHYLSETSVIQTGQAIVAHEPTERASNSISNPKVRAEINYRLLAELDTIILTPEEGIQRVRKVLHRFGLNLPALYEADYEGDEHIFDVDQFGLDTQDSKSYLYLIYALNDENHYDFYAELTDEDGIDDIIYEDEEEEEEDEEK